MCCSKQHSAGLLRAACKAALKLSCFDVEFVNLAIITYHFSGPATAVGLVCVYVRTKASGLNDL